MRCAVVAFAVMISIIAAGAETGLWLPLTPPDDEGAALLPRPLKIRTASESSVTIEVAPVTRRAQRLKTSLSAEHVRRLEGLRLPAGSYTITIGAPGHRSQSFVTVVPAEAKERMPATVALQRFPVIRGVVRDSASGEPVQASVSSGNDENVATGSDGSFALVVRDEWPAELLIEAGGYAPMHVEVPNTRDHLRLSNILMSHGGSIRLELAHADDLTIELVPDPMPEKALPSRRFVRKVKKDDSVVELTGLAPGRYVALFEGSAPLERYALQIAVEEGITTERQVALEPTPLRIRAIRGDEPLADVTLNVSHERGWKSQVRLGASGVLETAAWQHGRASVAAIPKGGGGVVDDYRIGEAPNEWRIEMPDRTVAGRVVEAGTDKPVPDAVVVYQFATGTTTQQKVGPDGRFSFAGLGSAEGSIRAMAGGYLETEAPVRSVPGMKKHDVLLTLRRGIEVVLQAIDDATGAPIDGAFVFSEGLPSRTAADGTCALVLSPGQRKRVFVLPPYGSFAILDVEGVPRDEPIRVAVPPASAQLAIRVSTDDDRPMPNVGFLFRYNGNVIPPDAIAALERRARRPIRTDVFGLLTIDAMPPGVYDFWPMFDERLLDDSRANTPSGKAPVHLIAAAGRNYAEITLRDANRSR